MATKANENSHVSGPRTHIVKYFSDISTGPSESLLRFRLIHSWEARNISGGGTFLGLELLLIDEQGTVMQRYISPNRARVFSTQLIPGKIYTLMGFFALKSKEIYQVADPCLTISFSHTSILTRVEGHDSTILPDRFRLHSYDDFVANCGLRGDLYDVVGHIKVINGEPLNAKPMLYESDIAKSRHILVHIQVKEGPIIKLYLWDSAARDFYKKFMTSEKPPLVLLVTTVNPKRLGGNLVLSSMASSRVFTDLDAQPTIDYINWVNVTKIVGPSELMGATGPYENTVTPNDEIPMPAEGDVGGSSKTIVDLTCESHEAKRPRVGE